MSEKIIVKFKSLREAHYHPNSLEFEGMMSLFDPLACSKLPDMGDPDDIQAMQTILENVNSFEIESITFTGFRMIEFIKHEASEGNVHQFELKISEMGDADKEMHEFIQKMKSKSKINVIGGTLDELKERMGDMPDELKDVIRHIEKKKAELSKVARKEGDNVVNFADSIKPKDIH